MSQRSPSLPSTICFGLLMRSFPRQTRMRYGREMLDAFVQERDRVRRAKGSTAAFRFSLAACFDVTSSGLKARRNLPLAPERFSIRRGVARSSMHGSATGVGEWLRDTATEARFALRGLMGAPAFTLVAVLSLALGIGVNTSLATIVQEVWLAPVPGVTEQEELVETVLTEAGHEVAVWSYPDFLDVKRTSTAFESLVATASGAASLDAGGRSQRVNVTFVSPDFFRTLGVAMSRGRDFLPSEDIGAGANRVAVVSHDLWQNELGGDPEALGRTISLNRDSYTVIGVASAAFTGARPLRGTVDLWVPISQHPLALEPNSETRNREARWFQVLGRTRPGVSLEETNASLRTVLAALEAEYPETNEGRSALARSFGRFPAQNRYGDMAAVLGLFVMVGLILLIICGNVAGMVLSRSAGREHEIAVRMALGSGRARLVRHLMVEALILAAAGGALGILVGFWAAGFATPARLGVSMTGTEFQPSAQVFLYSVLLTAAATLFVGLLPALRFSRPLVSSLKDETKVGGRRIGRVHRFAASAQTGVALLFLITCTLFVRAQERVEEGGFGFEPNGLSITRVHLSEEGYGSLDRAVAVLDRLKASVEAVPGVDSVSIADGIPLDLTRYQGRAARTNRPAEEGSLQTVELTHAGEGFFETIGTPLLRGRGFLRGDHRESEPVAVITQDLADLLWPGEEALGQQLRFPAASESERELSVVGVVGRLASSTATRDLPQVFLPLRQQTTYGKYGLSAMLVMRTSLDAATLAAPVQEAILQVDPDLSFPTIVTSESLIARSTEPQRATANISAGLGLLALILAAIGVYGVVAFAVASRTREIGIRMAMGATRPQVLRNVFSDGVRLALPGLIVGAVASAGLALLMRSMLFGLSPLDPVSFAIAAAILLLVVLLASLVPARRAASIEPIKALRHQ